MDGLSTLSEEEQESVNVQTEENQQQTKLLQSNIDRYSHISTNNKNSITHCVQGSQLPLDWETQVDYSCLTTVMGFQC